MLILTRRVDEALIINEIIKVIVMSVDGNQVRFRIIAPKNINVVREEVLDKPRAKIAEDNGDDTLGALIITRRLKETFFLGKEIKMTLLGIDGNQVRIGTQAPKKISILREELTEIAEKASGNVQSIKEAEIDGNIAIAS